MAKLAKAKKLTQLALVTELMEEDEETEGPQREWAKSWLQKREDPAVWCQLYTEVEESDLNKFRAVFRMMPELFNELLERVKPRIEKQDTQLRQAIPAKLRLMVTLR